MDINIIKKKFLLAGYETAIDFNKDFSEEMMWVRSELKRGLNRINGKNEPVRLIGFWQPWQAFISAPDPKSAAKAKYFFGVEISSIDGISSDFVVKSVPESEYAVYREQRRGTAPKAEMYSVAGYEPNHEIAGDFEIFDDFGHLGEDNWCDVLVPIKLKGKHYEQPD